MILPAHVHLLHALPEMTGCIRLVRLRTENADTPE